MPDLNALKHLKTHFFCLTLVAVFVGLMFRNSGMYPSVFADEYTYSMYARLLPFSDSTIPGYLYLMIYRTTNACGDGFLQCARVLNAAFFVGAGPFIYAAARRYCNQWIAIVIALISIIGPISSFTAYFMPEALYFFSFWVFTWYVLGLEPNSKGWRWGIAGLLLGLSALVKPHSLLFVPAILVYVVFLARMDKKKFWFKAFRDSFWFLASIGIAKLSISYLLAGRAGITLLGSAYSSIAGNAAKATSFAQMAEHYRALLSLSAQSIAGHIQVVVLLFAAPVTIVFYFLIAKIMTRRIVAFDRVVFFAFIVLANLLCVTALFTASVAGTSLYEKITRLHMRYYDFALPLLYLVMARQLQSEKIGSTINRLLAITPAVIVIAYTVYTKLAPFTPSHIDGPEIRGVFVQPGIFIGTVVISILSLLVWAIRPRIGVLVFILGIAPAIAIVASARVGHEQRGRETMDAFDRAGLFMRQYIPKSERPGILVVSDQSAALYRALFYVDEPKASLLAIPSNTTYDADNLPSDKEWLITVGSNPRSDSKLFQVRMDGFTLTRANRNRTIHFNEHDWPGIVDSIAGLSSVEAWGTWSDGSKITINFAEPLPKNVKLDLIAKAYGPNIGNTFIARIGNTEKTFVLGADPQEQIIQIENPESQRTLVLEVPHPMSPARLGLGGDGRELGLGLVELKVE